MLFLICRMIISALCVVLIFTIMFSALYVVFYCYDNDSRPVLFFIVKMMIRALCVFFGC